MKAPTSRTFRLASAAIATTWIAASTAGPASAADDGNVSVVNTETVQVYLNSSGKIDAKRIYEQIDLTGHGKVNLRNPVETRGLRNLDGFSGFDVVGGQQVVKTTVDGSRRFRSVSDFSGKLPLDVSIAYKLDGKRVKPGDVVGKSGELAVEFTVENVTSQEEQVTYSDGKGGTVTKTVEVPVPIVGSLSTVAPSNFTDVRSAQANVAGDGEGGTKLSFTMTLFPPVGSTTATFGYTADIKDGVVPRVDISALPVNPLESPTFKSAAQSYQGGADTGSQLTAGATEIDTNLLKLRDGAADLLAGLIQLNDGAVQLSSGLNSDAAPGAQRLADGASKLDAGLGQLDDGASQLADGSSKLDAGAKKLNKGAGALSNGLGAATKGASDLKSGAAQVASGQSSLASGLKQLQQGVAALPAQVKSQVEADPKYQALTGALTAVIQGIGTLSDLPTGNPATTTLVGGLRGVKFGLRAPGTTDCSSATPANCGVLDAIETMKASLSAALAGAGPALSASLTAVLTSTACQADPQCAGGAAGLQAILTGPNGLPAQLNGLVTKLDAVATKGAQLPAAIDLMLPKVSTGVDPATCVTNPAACGAREALLTVSANIPVLIATLSTNVSQTLLASIGTGGQNCDPTKTLVCAADALAEGSSALDDGAGTLLGGVKQLAGGGKQLSAGAGDLSAGTGDLRAGADKLAAGATDAADGSSQLADGAGALADGLGAAAVGSQQLADGLSKAAAGAPQLVDGSERLSTEGTKKLVAAGESTAQNYGEMVAVIDAGAKRAETQDMVYGAPADAIGLAAYSYVIEGENGEGSRNLTRGLGAVVFLAIGAGVLALRRRFV